VKFAVVETSLPESLEKFSGKHINMDEKKQIHRTGQSAQAAGLAGVLLTEDSETSLEKEESIHSREAYFCSESGAIARKDSKRDMYARMGSGGSMRGGRGTTSLDSTVSPLIVRGVNLHGNATRLVVK